MPSISASTVGEVFGRHAVTEAEFGAALGWLMTAAGAGELPLAADRAPHRPRLVTD
jgi:hypothetical protein